MLSEIRIYFEGDKSLKAGFDTFLQQIRERASAKKCKLSIIATGGKYERDFAIATRKHPAAWNILLRDGLNLLDGGDDGILVPRRQRCAGKLLQDRFPQGRLEG